MRGQSATRGSVGERKRENGRDKQKTCVRSRGKVVDGERKREEGFG